MTGCTGLLGHILKETSKTKEAAAHYPVLGKAGGEEGLKGVMVKRSQVLLSKEFSGAGYGHLMLTPKASGVYL